ncbi:MAG: Kelch repeat-containing protein [Planctomycetota bacterium]|jgi:hypothetical protein
MRIIAGLSVVLLLGLGCERKEREAPPPKPPAAPILDPVASPTNLSTQTISGTAPAGVPVNVTGGAAVVQGSADSAGRFALNVALLTAPSQETVNTLFVTYVQGSLWSDAASARIVHDPVAPQAPEVTPGQSPTNANPVVITGLTEPNAVVTVFGGPSSAAAPADGAGNFSLTVPLFPNLANALLFFATDAAGNTSGPKAETVVHDDIPPAAAVVNALRAYHDGVRTVVEGNIGAVEGSAWVQVQDVSTLNPASTVQASTTGVFVTTVTGGGGGNTIEITVTDMAGNPNALPNTTITVNGWWGPPLATAGTPPSARVWAGADHDWVNNRLFVFGGLDSGGVLNNGYFLTMPAFPGVWTWSTLGAAGPPAARYGHRAHFDPTGGRMIVFGGHDPAGPTWFQDLNALDVSVPGSESWSVLTGNPPPPARAFHGSGFDTSLQRLYVYGGEDTTGALSDLWVCDLSGASPVWTALAPTGTPPPALKDMVSVFDSANGRFVLFGGRDDSGQLSNAVHVLDVSGSPAWTAFPVTGTPPSAREGAGGALDPVGLRLFIFGGDDDSARLNDMHILNLNAGEWTTPGTGGPPPVAEGLTFTMDTLRLRTILFGGSSDGSTGTFYNGIFIAG